MRYAHDPVAYESEEWSRPDEMALFNLLWSQTRRELDTRPGGRVLDQCCGSGMSLLGSVSHPHLGQAIGVDLSPSLLEFAKCRFSPVKRVSFVCGDAARPMFPPDSFDLVLSSSAYHHIDPSRKTLFLAGCRELLKADGRLLLAENLLPPYDDEKAGYDRAVDLLYSAVTRSALNGYPHLPSSTQAMIHENVVLSRRRQYEYKVDRQRLLRDVTEAGFLIVHEIKAWPGKGEPLDDSAGNFLFVLRKQPRSVPA